MQKWKVLLRGGERSKVEAWTDQAKSWVEMFLEKLRNRPQDGFFMWNCNFILVAVMSLTLLDVTRSWNSRWEGCAFPAWIAGFVFVYPRPACLCWSSICAGIPSRLMYATKTLLLSIKAGLNLFQKKGNHASNKINLREGMFPKEFYHNGQYKIWTFEILHYIRAFGMMPLQFVRDLNCAIFYS